MCTEADALKNLEQSCTSLEWEILSVFAKQSKKFTHHGRISAFCRFSSVAVDVIVSDEMKAFGAMDRPNNFLWRVEKTKLLSHWVRYKGLLSTCHRLRSDRITWPLDLFSIENVCLLCFFCFLRQFFLGFLTSMQ